MRADEFQFGSGNIIADRLIAPTCLLFAFLEHYSRSRARSSSTAARKIHLYIRRIWILLSPDKLLSFCRSAKANTHTHTIAPASVPAPAPASLTSKQQFVSRLPNKQAPQSMYSERTKQDKMGGAEAIAATAANPDQQLVR